MRYGFLSLLIGRSLAPVAFFGFLLIPPASAREIVAGPVQATISRVIDGDTFVAEAHVWPGETVRVSIRIRGIDAPELHSRCPAEKAAAEKARDALASLLGSEPVLISNIGGGKYYGRVLADVETSSGDAVGPALLREALVRPYYGGHRRPYCG
jgi:endonuclease YncB( thermonuclease family)